MSVNSDNLARYVELDARKRELKDEQKQLNAEMRELGDKILRDFEREGIQNLNINGVTLYVHRQLWAGAAGDKQQACEALKRAGLLDYVTENFNTQSLSAWVREQVALADDDDLEDVYDALPPEFRDAINVSERFELRARRG